jgi:hypothetical protein
MLKLDDDSGLPWLFFLNEKKRTFSFSCNTGFDVYKTKKFKCRALKEPWRYYINSNAKFLIQ